MLFELIVEADQVQNPVRMRLLDKHGRQLASRQVRLWDYEPAQWEGLFDTHQYVDRGSAWVNGWPRWAPLMIISPSAATREEVMHSFPSKRW